MLEMLAGRCSITALPPGVVVSARGIGKGDAWMAALPTLPTLPDECC
jgi:hypothetical protein